MKALSGPLTTFLEDAQEYVRADLYTFTLNGGGVLRYCSANLPLTTGGITWNLGPPISDQGVQSQRGTSPSSVDITVLGDERFLVNGVQFLDFVLNLGLDGATVRIDRAFAASWQAMAATGPIGTYCRFVGRFAEAKELGQTQVVITATDYRDTLGQTFPPEVYQTQCVNVFGTSPCPVNLAALAISGSATATGTSIWMASSTVTGQSNVELGTVRFTSGPNAGLQRSVKYYTALTGTIYFTAPFPSVISGGDAFVLTPGCALSMAACQTWLPSTWQSYFRGMPFVPPPSTGLPT